MKTTFSSGVIVTSQWLNGAKQISFDGQDLDWHYPPLGLNSFITAGPNGLDSRYVTLATPQPNLEGDVFQGGYAISGTKVVSGVWNFGYSSATGNPENVRDNAPKSYTTNDKYLYAAGISPATIPQKFDALQSEDLITKLVLKDQIEYLLDSLVIDNGWYYLEDSNGQSCECNNYSLGPVPPRSTTICNPC
jgi:hypothetical protein